MKQHHKQLYVDFLIDQLMCVWDNGPRVKYKGSTYTVSLQTHMNYDLFSAANEFLIKYGVFDGQV